MSTHIENEPRETGPLAGIRIIEMPAVGPVPFAGMLLAELGAEVIRIERMTGGHLGIEREHRYQTVHRSRRSIAVDLKKPEGVATILRLVEDCDGLIEGFRPGVMERLGISPATCLEINPRFVFGRMTGWGQTGPLSEFAGHDINYIAVSGLLSTLGPKNGPPTIPLNLIGDYGGGALYLCVGMLSAIVHSTHTGEGDVVDVSMLDGVTSLMTPLYGLLASGMWKNERESNFIDGGAPFYRAYETLDEKFVAVGPIEKKFYRNLLAVLDIDERSALANVHDNRDEWQPSAELLAIIFKRKTRDEWTKLFQDTDACVSPVMELKEASRHQHNMARDSFVEVDGVVQPGPAPRFMRHDLKVRCPPPDVPKGETLLASFGFKADEIAELKRNSVIR